MIFLSTQNHLFQWVSSGGINLDGQSPKMNQGIVTLPGRDLALARQGI